MRRAVLAAFALALATGSAVAAEPACPPQPLPPPAEALTPLGAKASVITFSARPSLDYPGRAWVVRLSKTTYAGAADLEIVRLRRQSHCNRYEVEKRWHGLLPAEQAAAVVQAVAPLARPPENLFSPDASTEIVLDGTGVTLSVQTLEWQVTRELNHFSRDGGRVSALFHALIAKHVPASELPTEAWRTPREP